MNELIKAIIEYIELEKSPYRDNYLKIDNVTIRGNRTLEYSNKDFETFFLSDINANGEIRNIAKNSHMEAIDSIEKELENKREYILDLKRKSEEKKATLSNNIRTTILKDKELMNMLEKAESIRIFKSYFVEVSDFTLDIEKFEEPMFSIKILVGGVRVKVYNNKMLGDDLNTAIRKTLLKEYGDGLILADKDLLDEFMETAENVIRLTIKADKIISEKINKDTINSSFEINGVKVKTLNNGKIKIVEDYENRVKYEDPENVIKDILKLNSFADLDVTGNNMVGVLIDFLNFTTKPLKDLINEKD